MFWNVKMKPYWFDVKDYLWYTEPHWTSAGVVQTAKAYYIYDNTDFLWASYSIFVLFLPPVHSQKFIFVCSFLSVKEKKVKWILFWLKSQVHGSEVERACWQGNILVTREEYIRSSHCLYWLRQHNGESSPWVGGNKMINVARNLL